jgi:hypothetical protein
LVGVSGTGPLVTVTWSTVALEFVAALSALGVAGVAPIGGGAIDGMVEGVIGPEASCAQAAPASEAAKRAAAAILKVFTAVSLICSRR